MVAREGKWQDHYTRRAKAEKWLARSVYKLEEIDRRFKLIRPRDHLLDLGCYPGSWSQYSCAKVGPKGNVVGIDLQEPKLRALTHFRFIKADILTLDPAELRAEIGPRHVVLSDLAPQTTGVGMVDAARSLQLAGKAFSIALRLLEGGGRFLCKAFESEDLSDLRRDMSEHFDEVKTAKPMAVRKRSREVYLIAQGFARR
jgi:23S rRNA (uridine2552-2'-O)-methyltransferase